MTIDLTELQKQTLQDLLIHELGFADGEDYQSLSEIASKLADEKLLIFAYGTLKQGHFNHYRLGIDARLIAIDTIEGDLRVPSEKSYYPFLFEGSDKIKGEIWEVNDINFNVIHRMEVGAGYELRQVRTTTNRLVNVWIAGKTIKKDGLVKIDEFNIAY